MFEEVKEILLQFTDTDDIRKDSALVADLGLSSLDLVSIVMEFEDKFDIEVEDKDIHKLLTVNDIIEYIESKN